MHILVEFGSVVTIALASLFVGAVIGGIVTYKTCKFVKEHGA